MLWSLTDGKVRRARIADAAGLGAVHSAAWMATYRGIIPHDELEHMVSRRTPAWWRSAIRSRDTVLVLEIGGEIIGYATCGCARLPCDHDGEIYEIYLKPEYQGLGYGELLFEGCRGALDHKGFKGVIVWVLADNDRAVSFYWARGGRPVSKCSERFGGTRLLKIAYAFE